MTTTKFIKVPWLLAPKWKDFPMAKGLNHHRAPVGIILAANENIKVALTSETIDHAQVRLLNNDRETEKTLTIEKSSTSKTAPISNSTVSVPFIDCEYVDEIPSESWSVSVTYPTSSKVLPIFRYRDQEEIFFQEWDANKAEFAYIESDYFGLLIPEVDKEYARALPNGKHLRDLILFFDEIFTIYSRLIGLSFEEVGTNRNVRNRFFMKADNNGSGAAYYSDWCTAEKSESVKSYWMDLSPTNWGALHEIGHGHELHGLSYESFSTSEVWNNIFVVFYQHIKMGDVIFTKGRLYEEGEKMNKNLKCGVPLIQWGVFQKLTFLMHMFFRAGERSFIRFNQLARQEFAGNLFYSSKCEMLEKFMILFSTDFGLDLCPFMKLAKAVISDQKLLEYYYTFAEVVYPLNYLISDQKQLNDTKKKLHLFYDTSLVTPLDLRVTDLRGDVLLEIDKRIFSASYGEMFKFMDGLRTIFEKKISHQNILLKNIPIGVYKIFITSNAKNCRLIYDDVYAVVQANTRRTLSLSAKTMRTSSLLYDKIKFLGLGDKPFASLSVDFIKQVVKFHVFSDEPHSRFKGEVYVTIKIRNSKDDVIFEKILEGSNCTVKVHQIPLKETLKIEIFHAETETRLKTADPLMDAIHNRGCNTSVFYVNELGFQKEKTPKMDLADNILLRIDKAATIIRNLPFLNERPYCHPKYNLFLAIKTFKHFFKDHPLSSKLEEKYNDCLAPDLSMKLADNEEDDVYEMTQTTTGIEHILSNLKSSFLSNNFKFLGLSDVHVGTLYIDVPRKVVIFQVLSSEPHYRFKREGYFGVTMRNSEKEVIFKKIIEGTNATVGEYETAFSEQVEIEVFHAETISRLVSDNADIYDMIDRESNINTFVISKQEK